MDQNTASVSNDCPTCCKAVLVFIEDSITHPADWERWVLLRKLGDSEKGWCIHNKPPWFVRFLAWVASACYEFSVFTRVSARLAGNYLCQLAINSCLVSVVGQSRYVHEVQNLSDQ